MSVELSQPVVQLSRVSARLERAADRRVLKERHDILRDMLDVVDELDRALDAAGDGDASALIDGVELVREAFLAKLERYGVAPFEAQGVPFDPEHHAAVLVDAVDNLADDGVVTRVFRRGYAIDDDVLRVADVAVGQVR